MTAGALYRTLSRVRKKKSRKIYALVNPIAYAMEGAALVEQSTLDKLRAAELSAIEAFRTGQATVQDWRTISEFSNLAESMAREGIGPESLEAVQRCEEALIEAHDRYDRTGKMGTTAQGLTAFRDVYEYHDLQRQSVARSVYERHIQLVINKIKSKSPQVMVMKGKK